MDFIALFNGVVMLAKPVSATDSFATALTDELADLGLDSLDFIMLSMYLGDVYGIEEDTMHEMQVVTVGDFQEFLEKNKTLTPVSAELALESMQ